MKSTVRIFGDGSSLGNPGPGGWGAIIVDGDSVAERGGGEKHTTNNRMELTAAIQGLAHLGEVRRTVVLCTDSRYVINGITKWVHGWRKNEWKTSMKDDVLNRDLWERLSSLAAAHDIDWQYVPGHSGVPGNERVDEIATTYAKGDDPGLYSGSLGEYSIDIVRLEPTVAKVRTKSARSGKAYSYLSLVDGTMHRDRTWEACEARVKGKRGAKYKKALSAADEAAILREWGISDRST